MDKKVWITLSKGGTVTIFYNPPDIPQSNGLMSGDPFPTTENINVREHYANYLTVRFIVPGMKGFEELRALIQLMGEFMSEGRYYKLDMTIEELIDVLRTAGGDDIIRKKRAP